MARLLIREFIMDCRDMFRGWKLLVHIALFAFVIYVAIKEKTSFTMFILQYSIWTTIFMKPKVGKLFYLLPTGIQDRRYYILCKSIGMFIYNMLIYLSLVLMIGTISRHPVTAEMNAMFSDIIPVFIIYGAISMGTAYNWGKSRDKQQSKKYQNRNSTCILLMIYPMLKATLFDIPDFHWRIPVIEVRIVLSIISYICAFICLFLQISILWHTELSPENERKVEKLFS